VKRTAVRRVQRVLQKRVEPAVATAGVRAEIVSFGQRMSSSGLSPGKSGNISVRVDGGMLITPTGIGYHEMRTADIVEVRLDGRIAPGQRVASSEWQMHLAIYKARADVGAMVHTHSLNATALCCVHRGIPAFHYMVAEFGGDRMLAAQYARALAIGRPRVLNAREMARVVEKFKTYGKQSELKAKS
jgi:ribulose-5-phosphate 4-epimerase/fuculose-1-phosphate aldolase